MKKRTVIKNGRLVIESTDQRIVDKTLGIKSGYQVTQDSEIPPSNIASWGEFNYTEYATWQPSTLLCTVPPPSNGVSYGTAGALIFSANPNLGDSYPDTNYSIYRIKAGSAVGVVFGANHIVFTGTIFGHEEGNSRASMQMLNNTFQRDVNLAYNGAGKVYSTLEFNNNLYVTYNKGSQQSKLMKYNSFTANSMTLASAIPGAYYFTYYSKLYAFYRESDSKYYELDASMNPLERTRGFPGTVPTKAIEADLGTVKGFVLYKEDYQVVNNVGFSVDSNSMSYQPYSSAILNTKFGREYRPVDAVFIPGAPSRLATLVFDSGSQGAGILFKLIKNVGDSETILEPHIDTEFSPNSRIFYVNGVIFLASNPTSKGVNSLEVFYSTDLGETWNKVEGRGFNYPAKEFTINSITHDASGYKITGYLNTRNSQVRNNRTGTTITLRG